jgi:hypothetical protein
VLAPPEPPRAAHAQRRASRPHTLSGDPGWRDAERRDDHPCRQLAPTRRRRSAHAFVISGERGCALEHEHEKGIGFGYGYGFGRGYGFGFGFGRGYGWALARHSLGCGRVYTCPLHADLTATAAGQCPSCGHDLVTAAETGGRGLVCPMHRAIRQHVPGTCPTCGMELVEERSIR